MKRNFPDDHITARIPFSFMTIHLPDQSCCFSIIHILKESAHKISHMVRLRNIRCIIIKGNCCRLFFQMPLQVLLIFVQTGYGKAVAHLPAFIKAEPSLPVHIGQVGPSCHLLHIGLHPLIDLIGGNKASLLHDTAVRENLVFRHEPLFMKVFPKENCTDQKHDSH